MKALKFFIVILFVGALGASAASPAMAEGKGNDRRGGKAAAHMSSKGAANTNAQWSADPEKGWVRANERHELHKSKASSPKANPGKAKQKGKGKEF
ncbi:MAG TPA: hypothetical protein VNN13_13825 [Methylomirabilota bacterium]|nr:hypothetical protein [Methylomirabilota bacterium]